MNKVAIQKAIRPLLTNKNMDKLGYLWGRWQDEKEYEDFDEYANVMKAMVENAGIKFVKASKRPFGYTIDIGRQVMIYATATHLNWKTITSNSR